MILNQILARQNLIERLGSSTDQFETWSHEAVRESGGSWEHALVAAVVDKKCPQPICGYNSEITKVLCLDGSALSASPTRAACVKWSLKVSFMF